MECSVCGSQDTTLKTGISKSGKNAGKPWKAYDCNEKECKNEKGYPSRTFVPMGKQNLTPSQPSAIEKKLDEVLAILHKNFGKVKVEKEEDELPF